MKKLILGIVLVAVLLAGCQLFNCNRLLGSWWDGDSDEATKYRFLEDMTYEVFTFMDLPWWVPYAPNTGTYSYTDETLTMTCFGSTPFLYKIVGREMTWTWAEGGSSSTLTRRCGLQ